MNKRIIVIHKQVGKKLEFKKIENTPKEFEKVLGGKIEVLSFNELNDIFFICRKYRERLKPNVYINIAFGKLDETIRGDLIIVGKDFQSLTRKQALIYGDMILQESYDYSHFDESGRYLTNSQLKEYTYLKNSREDLRRLALDKNVLLPNGEFMIESAYQREMKNKSTEEILEMILKMQTIILQYIKNHSQ